MLLLKKYLGLILGLAAIAMIYIIWQETAKITGEVSAAGSTSGAVALSGARVTLYDVTGEQEQRISAALANLQEQSQQEKADNARVYSAESKDEMTRSNLASFNNLSDTKHCFALEKVLDEIRKSAVRKETTDSQGHFGTLCPGDCRPAKWSIRSIRRTRRPQVAHSLQACRADLPLQYDKLIDPFL